MHLHFFLHISDCADLVIDVFKAVTVKPIKLGNEKTTVRLKDQYHIVSTNIKYSKCAIETE